MTYKRLEECDSYKLLKMQETDDSSNVLDTLFLYYKDEYNNLNQIKSDKIVENITNKEYKFIEASDLDLDLSLERVNWIDVNLYKVLTSDFIEFYLKPNLYLCKLNKSLLKTVFIKSLNLYTYNYPKLYVYSNSWKRWVENRHTDIISISPLFNDNRLDAEKDPPKEF